MRPLLIAFFIVLAANCCGQDSTTAIYIDEIVQKIEARILNDIVETKDTLIYDDENNPGKDQYLTIRTHFYTNPQTMQLDKIVEKSTYKEIITEITVYFFGNQPVLFTNKQSDNNTVKFDFDIYYMNDKSVYCVKRNNLRGTPDGDTYLKWCRELQRDYQKIVQDYNKTFASRKSR